MRSGTEVVEVSELVDCTCVVCGNCGQMNKEQFVCSAAPILCRQCATESGPLYVLTAKGKKKERELLKDRIKVAISATGPFLTPDKIREQVPMSKKLLKALLNDMARKGEVGMNGDGAYTVWGKM